MEFYDANWTLRGTKQDSVVAEHISRITGIPSNVLGNNSERELQSICLGQRMSWAAYRKTSREEDIAYCLLGIFQVNMPMLYGEGNNAFLRLQEEILKHSTDLSLFAWTQHYQERPKQNYRGILSRNPREFYRLKNCSLLNTQFINTEEFVMTNKGLRFNTSLFRPASEGLTPDFVDINFMDLNCLIDGKPQGIFLQRIFDFYVRVLSDGWIQISSIMRRSRPCTIYVARDIDYYAEHKYKVELEYGVKIQVKTHFDSHYLQLVDAWPDGFFDRIKSTFLASTLDIFTGFVKIVITEKTLPVDERRRIADFILVVVFNLEKFLAYVLDEEHAMKFETFAKSTLNMDHTTATTELEKYRRATSKYSKSKITVTDSLTNMSFRVSVRPRTKKVYAGGLHMVLKAVKVELSL